MSRITLLLASAVFFGFASFLAGAEGGALLRSGTTTIFWDLELLHDRGVVVSQSQGGRPVPSGTSVMNFEMVPGQGRATIDKGEGLPGFAEDLRHGEGISLLTAGGEIVLEPLVLSRGPVDAKGSWSLTPGEGDSRLALYLQSPDITFDALSGGFVLLTERVVASRELARRLGFVFPEEVRLGSVIVRIQLADAGAPSPTSSAASSSYSTVGPDVIVGDLSGLVSYGTLNGVSAFSAGTYACNIGNQYLLWNATTSDHPIILTNMFRLKENRFEQIGMAWLKHGFLVAHTSLCESCSQSGGSQVLFPDCSDLYSASLNGNQSTMGPRYQANGYTGIFPYPIDPPNPPVQTFLDRRLQVHDTDLHPSNNPGAIYFVDGHYVTHDDAEADNSNNNASYRRLLPILAPDVNGRYTVAVDSGSPTQREKPAIKAWKALDPAGVVETDIFVPGDGMFLLAAKAHSIGENRWQYEYAVQNLNSDRSGGFFRVPIPLGVAIRNMSFHDVDYHTGEPYSLTDWTQTISAGSVTWATESYANNPNANALRFSTLYNFRFETNVPPADTMVTLGLFKPGSPGSVSVSTRGPAEGLVDCNRNGIADACDIDCGFTGCTPPCGTSLDCDGNLIPDDCPEEPDCQPNGVTDACDLSSGTSEDCDTNQIPDECQLDCDLDGTIDACDNEELDDCDQDGVIDCYDKCLCVDPTVGRCVCPQLDRCCCPAFCFPDFDRDACITNGCTPDCQELPCRDGCPTGDSDLDGDLDLRDVAGLQGCFSGPGGGPAFIQPTDECLRRINYNYGSDLDIDLSDLGEFQGLMTGPLY